VGVIMGVGASILLGLYSTLLARFIKEEIADRISFFNILAFIGVFNLITFWPLLIIFHYTGVETFRLPRGITIAFLAINIVFGSLLFNYFWGRATILIGPLLSNTAVILVVPISMVIDSFFIKTRFNWMYYVGTVLILIGFFGITTKDFLNARKVKDDTKDFEATDEISNIKSGLNQSLTETK